MNKLIVPILALTTLLASGCGDNKVREMRGAFIEECKNGGLQKDICRCIFSKYEDTYTKDQLLDMKIGIIPTDFQDVTVKSTTQCVRDN